MKDPSNLLQTEVIAIVKHWRKRESDLGADKVLHFHHVKVAGRGEHLEMAMYQPQMKRRGKSRSLSVTTLRGRQVNESRENSLAQIEEREVEDVNPGTSAQATSETDRSVSAGMTLEPSTSLPDGSNTRCEGGLFSSIAAEINANSSQAQDQGRLGEENLLGYPSTSDGIYWPLNESAYEPTPSAFGSNVSLTVI